MVTAINEEASATAVVGASPHHQLKRATSCPDERQIRDRLAAVVAGSGGSGGSSGQKPAAKSKSPRNPSEVPAKSRSPRSGGSKETATTSAQTDEFQVFPYEHLFPSVLPQWFVGSQGGAASQQKQQQPQPALSIADADVNPYDLLDDLINVSAARGEGLDLTVFHKLIESD